VALDELFDRYGTESKPAHSEIRLLGQGFADLLNSNDEPNQIIDRWPENNPYEFSLLTRDEAAFPNALIQQLISDGVVTLGSDEGLSFHYYLDQQEKVLSVQTPVMEDGGNKGLSWILTILFYAATLLLVFLWMRPLIHRHRILRQATKAFGEGNLASRIDTRGVTYIQDVEQGFNNMAERIQQLVEDNKMLTSAVSHDLRTPLARLRFGIDTLSHTTEDDSKAYYLKRINDDLIEMESLVESLLRYAQLDNVLEDVERHKILIISLVEECIAQHYDSNLSIHLKISRKHPPDSVMVYGAMEHIATLINNLLSNALTYASKAIIIEVSIDDDIVKLEFSDDGPGIPSDLRAQVIKPFERGAEPQVDNDGFGLGLAVAARIAQHHGGSIVIGDSERLGGASVMVTLNRFID